MRKYLYIILAAVILLEIITIIVYREALGNYIYNSVSSVIGLIAVVVLIGAVIIWLLRSF